MNHGARPPGRLRLTRPTLEFEDQAVDLTPHRPHIVGLALAATPRFEHARRTRNPKRAREGQPYSGDVSAYG
jgi:hypothetical protein